MERYLSKLPVGWFLTKTNDGRECLQSQDDKYGTFLRLLQVDGEWLAIRCTHTHASTCYVAYPSFSKVLTAIYGKK